MDDNLSQPAPNPEPPQPPPLRPTSQPVQTPPLYVPSPRAKSGTGWKVVAILACALFLCSLVVNPGGPGVSGKAYAVVVFVNHPGAQNGLGETIQATVVDWALRQ